MARNIELKARLTNPVAARHTAGRLATAGPNIEHQRDTYFAVPHGRLKLREIVGKPAQLVYYERSDSPDAKASDYQLLTIAEPNFLREMLTAALGLRIVVEKRREIFLYHNVRIHLDEVVGLGCFLEFEAVLGNGVDDAKGREQIDFLLGQFELSPNDLLSRSYSDMLTNDI